MIELDIPLRSGSELQTLSYASLGLSVLQSARALIQSMQRPEQSIFAAVIQQTNKFKFSALPHQAGRLSG